MKAQSAVEYLITYGWMLVAVGIVSGTFFSTVDTGCVESVSGFNGESVQVTDFGLNSDGGNISMLFENRRSETISIERVEFELGESSRSLEVGSSLSPYDISAESFQGFKDSEECNSIDFNIVYDIGSLEDRMVTGTLTAGFELDDSERPLTPESFDAGYPDI